MHYLYTQFPDLVFHLVITKVCLELCMMPKPPLVVYLHLAPHMPLMDQMYNDISDKPVLAAADKTVAAFSRTWCDKHRVLSQRDKSAWDL